MFYLQQIDRNGIIVDSITYQTKECADAAYECLNFILETSEISHLYDYKIVQGKKERAIA